MRDYIRMSVFLQGGSVHDEDDPEFGPNSFEVVVTVLYQTADRVGIMFKKDGVLEEGECLFLSGRHGDIAFAKNYVMMRASGELIHCQDFGEAPEIPQPQETPAAAVERLIEMLQQQTTAAQQPEPQGQVPDDAHYGLYL